MTGRGRVGGKVWAGSGSAACRFLAPLPSYWMRRVSAPASCLFWAKCTRLLQSGVSAPVKCTGVRNSSRYGQRTWGQCHGLSQ